MKATPTSICLSAALFSVQVSAGVTLNLDECIQTHVVNGIGHKSSAGTSIELNNGSNQIVVSCAVTLGRSNDDSFPEVSDAFVLQFTATDTELTLSAPTIQSHRQLERFNSEGNFRLVSFSGQTVPYRADVLKKEGFQVFRDYVEELEAFNRASAPATLSSGASDTTGSAKDENKAGRQTGAEDAPDQNMVRQMLRYWYLRADMKTRNEFKSWMTSSDQPL